MYHAKQRLPLSFIALGQILEEGNFTTVDELKAIPFIKKWVDSKKVKRLSLLKGGLMKKNALMAEMEDNHYCVIAWVSKEFNDLPEFRKD